MVFFQWNGLLIEANPEIYQMSQRGSGRLAFLIVSGVIYLNF